MRRKHLLLLAVLLAGSVRALPVRADGTEQDELQKRFQEGKALFDQKKFADARVKFLQACAILETANCPKNLALTEVELGLWPEAATHFQAYLDDPRTNGEAVRVEIERKFLETKSKVGELDLEIDVGARVRVDGKLVGTSPIGHPIFVAPGDHEVEANWAMATKSSKLSLVAGKAAKIELHQDVPPPPVDTHPVTPPPDNPPPPPPPAATTPAAPVVPSGPTVPTAPPKSKGPAIAIGGVLAAGGILGLVGFGVFTSGSNSSRDEADAYKNTGVCVNPDDPRCLDYKSKRDSQDTQHTLAIVSLVFGLAFTTGGTALLVFAATSKKATGIHVTPSVSPHGMSFALSGSF